MYHTLSTICKKASRQINAIMKLSNVLGKGSIFSSFIRGTFSYCLGMWMFSGQPNIKKLELLQYHALKLVFNDYTDLLRKGNNMSVSVCLKYVLCIELQKFINA